MRLFLILSILFLFTAIGCKQKTAEDYYNMALKAHSKEKIDLLDKAIEMNPDYFAAVYQRAEEFYKITVSLHGICTAGEDKDYYRKSVHDYTEAIRLQPTNGALYCTRSGIEGLMGDTAKANQDILKAHSLGYNSCK